MAAATLLLLRRQRSDAAAAAVVCDSGPFGGRGSRRTITQAEGRTTHCRFDVCTATSGRRTAFFVTCVQIKVSANETRCEFVCLLFAGLERCLMGLIYVCGRSTHARNSDTVDVCVCTFRILTRMFHVYATYMVYLCGVSDRKEVTQHTHTRTRIIYSTFRLSAVAVWIAHESTRGIGVDLIS